MRGALVLVWMVAACGRYGFDSTPAGDGNGDDVDAPPGAVTTTFGETPTADVMSVTSDTAISSEVGSVGNNYGASTRLDCEAGRALIRFDVSFLAPGTPVFSAALHVNMGGVMGSVTIAPLLEDWTAGTKTGSPGVANNTQRTAADPWTTVGAGAPGSSGSAIAMFGSQAGANTIKIPAATVKGWIDSPATNFGVALSCASDANLTSSEGTTASQRPQLDVIHL